MSRPAPIADRLAKYTSQSDGCHEWTGHLDRNGYGRLNVGGSPQLAYRLAWELANGAVPLGMELDHLCRNRACVRVDHLEPVTHAENMRRMRSEVCAKNHARIPGERECGECSRERGRRNYDLNRERRVAYSRAYRARKKAQAA